MDQRLEMYRAELAYQREPLLQDRRARRLQRAAVLLSVLRARDVARSVRDRLVRAA